MLTPPPAPPPGGARPPLLPLPYCPPPDSTTDAPADRTDGGKFAPGHTLGGRPPGSQNRATIILQSLFESGAGELGAAVMLSAVKRGDMTAARLVLERLYPVRRGAPVEVPGFPVVQTAADVPRALAALVAAVTAGRLTADEAKPLADLLGSFVAALDATTFAERLAALEARQAERGTQ